VPLAGRLSLTVLTSPSLFARQRVSTLRRPALFRCPDESLALRSTGCESPIDGWLSVAVLTSHSLCSEQRVSAPRWLTFSRCRDESPALCWTAGEYPSLADFLSLS
jgi:hypothetical protein